MMVPFDSSRRELSNGCYIIVILSNFDIYHENPAAAVTLEPLGHFLTPFLTGFIGKSCSDEAE